MIPQWQKTKAQPWDLMLESILMKDYCFSGLGGTHYGT